MGIYEIEYGAHLVMSLEGSKPRLPSIQQARVAELNLPPYLVPEDLSPDGISTWVSAERVSIAPPHFLDQDEV